MDSTEDVYQSAARRQGGITSGTRSPKLPIPILVLSDPLSTADEIPANGPTYSVIADYVDPPNEPCATFKVFYRPRGRSLMLSHVCANTLARTIDSSGRDPQT